MSGWDRAAIDLGLPELLLMENASREALHVFSAETGQMPGKRVLLFMGGGNNGGDAACLARHLHDGGAEVLVLHTRPLGAYRGVTGQHVRLARRCGLAFAPAAGWPEKYRNTPWDVYADASVCERGGPDIVVDGILGTGFSGSLRPLELELVGRLLTGDIQHLRKLPQTAADLEHQRRLADARRAAHEHERALDRSAAEHAVEFTHAG